MPPGVWSRFRFTKAIRDTKLNLYLTDRVPFEFRELADNIAHLVLEGDTLFTLAGRYYQPIERACGFWWVIADFQPTPIIDPTIKLEPGTTVFIPSLRTLRERIFAEDRRRLH